MRQLVIITIFFLWYQRGNTIDQPEVFHNLQSIFYVNPAACQIRSRVKGNGIADVYAVFGSERIAMMRGYQKA